jgi:hypothetical protein
MAIQRLSVYFTEDSACYNYKEESVECVRDIMALCCENYKQHINTLFWTKCRILSVKLGGTHNKH